MLLCWICVEKDKKEAVEIQKQAIVDVAQETRKLWEGRWWKQQKVLIFYARFNVKMWRGSMDDVCAMDGTGCMMSGIELSEFLLTNAFCENFTYNNPVRTSFVLNRKTHDQRKRRKSRTGKHVVLSLLLGPIKGGIFQSPTKGGC